RERGRLATVTGVRPPSRFGEIEHSGGIVKSFNEKPQVNQGLINGGFFFFEYAFLKYLTTDPGCILEHAPLERCVHEGHLGVFDHEEVEAAVKASLDFWLTLGPEGALMEKELQSYLGVKQAVLVNSGSSANLVAFMTLTSPTLDRPIVPGDEVITVAASFPTT